MSYTPRFPITAAEIAAVRHIKHVPELAYLLSDTTPEAIETLVRISQSRCLTRNNAELSDLKRRNRTKLQKCGMGGQEIRFLIGAVSAIEALDKAEETEIEELAA
jgi:hypothetical protein